MYIFNPDHDLALANFSPNFTSPASARKLRCDLAMLPVWYAQDGELVVVDGELNRAFLEELRDILPIKSSLITFHQLADFRNFEVKPWGWNPNLRKQLIKLGVNEQLLPSISDIELLRNYSGRQNAIKLLRELKVWNPVFCGESYLYTDIDKLVTYLNSSNSDQVLKMPYSGSGKGIVWIKGDITDKQTDWCKRVINIQGGVVVEPVLNKVQDFAMEFEMTDSGVKFVGYSLFQSAPSGAYVGNLLLSDIAIEDILSMYIDRNLLLELQAKLKTKLTEYFPLYHGYLGVDMMICETSESNYQLQPCIEINMRMNMGIVAHSIYERFVHPDSNGIFSINYFKQDGEAQNHASTIQSDNPLIIKDGKIKNGYLSLTPVDKHTQYIASVYIKQNHEENS